jgi:hypothetical protein
MTVDYIFTSYFFQYYRWSSGYAIYNMENHLIHLVSFRLYYNFKEYTTDRVPPRRYLRH